ncbi:MAG: ATP-binding protein [Deltaproteobacteria bacterium]|nr:ATP-binding protein [Deltaproteobacteria bacterium]
MVSRQLTSWLESVAGRPQAVHLVGLRQTGKTTLMEEFSRRFENKLCYRLQDLVTLRRYEKEPERWVLEIEGALENARSEKKPPLHVFVDEIQKIPVLMQGIQGLYDANKGRIKFWVWGSSARPLKKQRAETLAGRVLMKTLWPLSQAEILGTASAVPRLLSPNDLKKAASAPEPRAYSESLKKWLSHGLLPEPCLLADYPEAADLLLSFQATYLENEIRRENLVRDIGVFEDFLTLAAGDTAAIVDYSKIASVLGVSSKSVQSYYEILADTYVCTLLPAYSGSLRVQISKSPKAYFSDAGLARFVSGERGGIARLHPSFGKAFENFVIAEIAKQTEYHGLGWKLSYLRTKAGQEADLVVSTPDVAAAIEIKASSRVGGADLAGLKVLMGLEPKLKFGLVISTMSGFVEIEKGIFNVPVWVL